MPSDILTEFIDDAREHLMAASDHLLALERDPTKTSELHGLLRRLHTIKGNAGFLDLRHLYNLLHAAENILQSVREQDCVSCDPGLIDVQLRVLDTVETMINNLSQGDSDFVDGLSNLLNELGGLEQSMISAESTAELDSPLDIEASSPAKKGAIQPSRPATLGRSEPVSATPATTPSEPSRPTGGLLDKINQLLVDLNILAGDEPQTISPKTLEKEFDLLKVQVNLLKSPRLQEAYGLLEAYLTEVHDLNRQWSGTCLAYIKALLKNLAAWADLESKPHTKMLIFRVDSAGLEDQGGKLREQVQTSLAQGSKFFIFDLRTFQTMRSPEIGALISVLKMIPDQQNLGLIVDTMVQAGLLRVLHVMGLTRIYRIFPDEAQARSALG